MKRIASIVVAVSLLIFPILTHATSKSLVGISDDGKVLTFTDGSQYRIDSVLVPSTSAWRGGHQVEIFDQKHRDWVNVPMRNPLTGGTIYGTRIR